MEATAPLADTDLRTDEELITAVLGGEVDSFEELILRYQPRIFGMARKYFRNESDVEDAVQTIFTKTYQKLGSFKHTAPFEHDARGLPGQGVEDAALPVLMAEVCSPARVVRAGLRGFTAPLESVQGFAMAPL